MLNLRENELSENKSIITRSIITRSIITRYGGKAEEANWENASIRCDTADLVVILSFSEEHGGLTQFSEA